MFICIYYVLSMFICMFITSLVLRMKVLSEDDFFMTGARFS